MLEGIVGFEMTIEFLESKFKLGQERGDADKQTSWNTSVGQPKHRERSLQDLTESFYKRSQPGQAFCARDTCQTCGAEAGCPPYRFSDNWGSISSIRSNPSNFQPSWVLRNVACTGLVQDGWGGSIAQTSTVMKLPGVVGKPAMA